MTPNATRVLSNLRVLEGVRAFATSPSAISAIRGSDDVTLMRMPIGDAKHARGARHFLHNSSCGSLQRALGDALRRQSSSKLCFGSTVTDVWAYGDQISVGVKRGSRKIQDFADLLVGAGRCALARARAFRVWRDR